MSTWMLRSHIDGHRINTLPIIERLAIFNDILCFYILLLHISSLLLFLCPWLLTFSEFTAALIEFTTVWSTHCLVTNTRVSIIRNLTSPMRLGQVETSEWIILA